MGYAFVVLLQSKGNLAVVDNVLFVRGILSPAAHMAWTGIAAAALWDAGAHRWRGASALRFVGAFLVVVALHTAWDALGSTVVLGSMWVERGDPQEARRLFERALARAEQHPGAALATLGDLHVGLADVLVDLGELDAAEEHLATAQSLGDSASLIENRHRCYVASARLHEARGELERAVELLDRGEALHVPGFFPEVRPIPALRARMRIKQGRLVEAREWARERGLQQSPSRRTSSGTSRRPWPCWSRRRRPLRRVGRGW